MSTYGWYGKRLRQSHNYQPVTSPMVLIFLIQLFLQIFLSITIMVENKANGYFYYLPQTNVQYPQVFHTYPYTYSGPRHLPAAQVKTKLVQSNQPEKERTIVVDSESGVVVSCIDGSCNYAKEDIIPSTALLCNVWVHILIHYVLRVLKTSLWDPRCQTYVFKTKIA